MSHLVFIFSVVRFRSKDSASLQTSSYKWKSREIDPDGTRKKKKYWSQSVIYSTFLCHKKITFELRLTDLDLLFNLTKEQMKIATREHCLLARLQYYDDIGITVDDLVAAARKF